MPRLIALLIAVAGLLTAPVHADDALRTRLLNTLQPTATPVPSLQPPASIPWLSYQAALDTGLPLWIHVTQSRDCPWCERADELLADPETIVAAGNFACVRVDRATAPRDAYARWARHYGVTLAPTDLFLMPDLTPLGRKAGLPRSYRALFAEATKRAAAKLPSVPVVVESTPQPAPLIRPERSILSHSIFARSPRTVCGPNGCYLVP